MVKKKADKKFWFRKRAGNLKAGWGFVPVSWEGWVAIVLFFGVNFFAANYFNLDVSELDRWLKMGAVAFLSIFVFLLIARRKTQK